MKRIKTGWSYTVHPIAIMGTQLLQLSAEPNQRQAVCWGVYALGRTVTLLIMKHQWAYSTLNQWSVEITDSRGILPDNICSSADPILPSLTAVASLESNSCARSSVKLTDRTLAHGMQPSRPQTILANFFSFTSSFNAALAKPTTFAIYTLKHAVALQTPGPHDRRHELSTRSFLTDSILDANVWSGGFWNSHPDLRAAPVRMWDIFSAPVYTSRWTVIW